MRAAGEFHRQVLADPKLLRKYQKLAKRQGINLSAATMAAAMRLRQKAQSGRTLGDKG
jgi:uncharacterized protein YdbL (DUF1318 family)